MRHRAGEVRAVTALLEQEWDDTGDLAHAILDALVATRWVYGGWVVIVREDMHPPAYVAWGPYPTRAAAQRDIGARVISTHDGARGLVLRVVTPDTLEHPSPAVVCGCGCAECRAVHSEAREVSPWGGP